MRKNNLIIVTGRSRAGKSTFAKIGRDFFNYTVHEFSESLIEIEDALYNLGWDAKNIISKAYPRLKEDQIVWIIKKYLEGASSYKNFFGTEKDGKRRKSLQFLGTEIMRNYCGTTVHINNLADKIRQDRDYIITGARFENELDYLYENKAFNPSVVVIGNTNSCTKYNGEYLDSKGRMDVFQKLRDGLTHSSDIEWLNWLIEKDNIDKKIYYINNDTTISAFLSISAKFFEDKQFEA